MSDQTAAVKLSRQGAPAHRWLVRVALPLLFLATSSANAFAQTVATYGFTQGWATFGLALPKGAVTTGVKVGTLQTQTDVKTRWPDGTVRFAVVTARIGSAGNYAITPGPLESGAVPLQVPTARVSFTIAGTGWTATLPAATADVWLRGPLVSEWRALVAPVSGSTSHPFLRVLFDVRGYSDGTYRLDVAVQNTLDIASANSVTYDVSIVASGATVYSKSNVVHSYMTRWRKAFAIAGLTEANITPDAEPMIAAGALPRFLTTVPSDGFQVANTSDYDILGGGGLIKHMPDTGGRPEIAPYPDWAARYLVWKTQTLRAYVLKHGDLAGSWSTHITKADGVSLISIDENSQWWLAGSAANGPANGMAGNAGALGFAADNAHVPSLSYVPYLLTGDRYYADEMAFWANYVLITQPPALDARRGSEGLLELDQPRGIAWGLRNMVDAAAYLPDTHPMKAYLTEKVRNNLQWADAYVTSRTEVLPLAPTLDFGESYPGSVRRIMSQWQNDYIAWSLEHAGEQSFVGGRALIDRIVGVQLKLFTSPDWPRTEGAPYYIVLTNGAPTYPELHYLTTLTEIHQAICDVYGSDWHGFPPFAGAYGTEARLALLIAAKRGMTGAAESATWLMTQSGMVDYINSRSGYAIDGASLNLPPVVPPPAAPKNVQIIR